MAVCSTKSNTRARIANPRFTLARTGTSTSCQPKKRSQTSGKLLSAESFKGAAKEIGGVSLYFRFRRSPARLRQLRILVHQHIGDDFPRVVPFVNQLFQDAGVGM